MSTRRQAFTLIELLVVITIIGLLAGLIMALVGKVQMAEKSLTTTTRMESVSTGIAQMDMQQGSLAYAIQSRVLTMPSTPFYEGVLTFDTSLTTANALQAAALNTLASAYDPIPLAGSGNWVSETPPPGGAWSPGTATQDYDDHIFNYPWGKSYSTGQGQPMQAAEHHVLRNLNPNHTLDLLHFSDVLMDEPFVDNTGTGIYSSTDTFTDTNGNGQWDSYKMLYMLDRSAGRPWNDRWGHPLVVAYGFYQPSLATTNTLSINGLSTNPNVTLALTTYQYARSVYISVAAAGPIVRNISDSDFQSSAASNDATWFNGGTGTAAPTPPSLPAEFSQPYSGSWTETPLPTGSSTTPTGPWTWMIWKQANQICQQDKVNPEDTTWNETSFDTPPWLGVKQGTAMASGHTETCFLQAPKELR